VDAAILAMNMACLPDKSHRSPLIIQGGMGIAVSNWQLARAVSRAGHLGVVSGTALSTVFVRRLQDGDAGVHLRRALAHCPLPMQARQMLDRYFIAGGRPRGQPYRLAPMYSLDSSDHLTALTVVANFAEVWLAKENHGGIVGINLLEKIQLPTLASLYGAMLAGVDYVLMGAGIPRAIPGVLDQFAAGLPAELRIAVEGEKPGSEHRIRFDPAQFMSPPAPVLPRPQFLAIVSSSALATTLARNASGRVDGIIVEGASAGGHNAPPRGASQFNARGEPIYGPRDEVNLAAIRKLGLPFWLAGSRADQLREALELGAAGVQVGTPFAFCEESGLAPALKRAVLARCVTREISLLTDPLGSPTGMPFKVVDVPATISDSVIYEQRTRKCDLGYLRQPYQKSDGSVGYRCPAEPVEDYVRKGGKREDTTGRKCLCNGLTATIGLGQALDSGHQEPPIVTAGDAVGDLRHFLTDGRLSYPAADVLQFILGPARASTAG
jgi:NAD(P)H-dependent flavin oxidoreductase YrpB (nitropropane dioxygenase family)